MTARWIIDKIDTMIFQEVSINSLLEVKGCPKTTCWKVLVGK